MKKRKNRKQNMYNSIQHPLLSVDIIESAIQGEKWAKQKILLHYDSYINRLATRDLFDSQGNICRVVDSDLKSALQSKLLEGIARFQLR